MRKGMSIGFWIQGMESPGANEHTASNKIHSHLMGLITEW
jgi:hypothetical protein